MPLFAHSAEPPAARDLHLAVIDQPHRDAERARTGGARRHVCHDGPVPEDEARREPLLERGEWLFIAAIPSTAGLAVIFLDRNAVWFGFKAVVMAGAVILGAYLGRRKLLREREDLRALEESRERRRRQAG